MSPALCAPPRVSSQQGMYDIAVGGDSEEQGYEADQDEYQEPSQERIMNQPRQPVAGDIIMFYDARKEEWITARIRQKVRGYKHYYNVDLEDGGEDGLYCRPPKYNHVEQWTLLENYQWDPLPVEQLLDNPEPIPSRQASPMPSPQPRLEDQELEDQLDLELLPGQQLQTGRSHSTPLR